MSAITVILSILIILVAIGLIAVVLLQEGNKQGLGAIGGGAETFFGKNKAKSYEGKLALITKILIVVFIVLALVMTIVVSANNPDTTINMEDLPLLEGMATAAPADEAVESTEETAVETETVEADTETSAETETVESTEETAAETEAEPEATAEAEE